MQRVRQAINNNIIRRTTTRFYSSSVNQGEPRRGGGFMYKLFGLLGVASFSWLLYENWNRDKRFNDMLESQSARRDGYTVNSNNNDNNNDYDQDSNATVDSYGSQDHQQMDRFLSVLKNKLLMKGSYLVVNLARPDQKHMVNNWVALNQSNSMRDVDMLYVDCERIQSNYAPNLVGLHKLLRSHENNCRMRVLKGTNNNRPLIMLFGDVNAMDNSVLDVLKLYATRWSEKPDYYGIAAVFAGTTIKMKFMNQQNVSFMSIDDDSQVTN